MVPLPLRLSYYDRASQTEELHRRRQNREVSEVLLHDVHIEWTTFAVQRLECFPDELKLNTKFEIASRQRPVYTILRREAEAGNVPIHIDETVPRPNFILG